MRELSNLKLHSEILGGTYTRAWSDTHVIFGVTTTCGYLDELEDSL